MSDPYAPVLTVGADGKTYKVFNGTWYRDTTPDGLIYVLDACYKTHTRVIVEFGDRETKKFWGDSQTGYIGRSSGSIKIPLSVYNRRSIGGPALMESPIVRVIESNGKRILWQAWGDYTPYSK